MMAIVNGKNENPEDTLFAAIDQLSREQEAEDAAKVVESPAPAPVAPTLTSPVGVSLPQPAPTPPITVLSPEPLSPEPDEPFFIEPKADLIWGASGTGKTVNIGEVSDYVLAKYGKLTRMVSADGGGIGPLTGLAKSGQIEFWALNAWKNPIANLERAIKGYWPLRLDDPDSPLVPPDAGTWEVYGFGAFEGLTSFGDMILDSLSGSKASLSQDPSYSWSQDGIEFSGENQSYYGFMQKELQRKVALSHLLKYEKVLWTAQESKGEEKGGGIVYGPMIGGKKATGKAAGWFLNVFHMDVIQGPTTVDLKTGQKLSEATHILFLKTHIDPLTLIPYPTKFRAPKKYKAEVPTYLESGSVAEAYRLLDTFYEKQLKESAGRLGEIKGMKEKLMERAAKARLAEAAAAEKRAVANKLLKPLVTVLGGTTVPSGPPVGPKEAAPISGVVGGGSQATPPAPLSAPLSTPVIPTPIKPDSIKPASPVKITMPTIQNVRKKV
jgi:hypothetical protein